MEIEKLTERLKKRDAFAEEQLYALLYRHLFKIPLSYCKDRDEATLVFNHSMLYVFEHLKAFKNEVDLLKWASRIIKNDCIDQIRKNTVYKNKLSVFGKSTQSWSINEAITSLAMADILNCIQQLENTYRLCFVLHELEGHTHKEIAQKLNISSNTSKWYLRAAKKQLRQLIEKKGVTYSKRKSNF